LHDGGSNVKTRLILNGKKASRPDIRDAVDQLRREGHELEVRVTWEFGDGIRLVGEASHDGIERVIAGGGDGSVNEIANGLLRLPEVARPAMGILPLGTANDFATACGVPTDPRAALELVLEGEEVPVDLARANDRYFVNIASAGFGAAITAETPVELKNFLGGGAYTIMGLLKALQFRPYEGSLRTPDGDRDGSVIVGAICNGRQAGGGQSLAPEARIDDGLLDIVLLSPFPIADVAVVAREIAEPTPDGKYVTCFQAPWVEVKARDPIPVNLDGEPISDDEIRFEIVPRAVRMVLPSDCPCVGPS
jgi:lipid kinase YegS